MTICFILFKKDQKMVDWIKNRKNIDSLMYFTHFWYNWIYFKPVQLNFTYSWSILNVSIKSIYVLIDFVATVRFPAINLNQKSNLKFNWCNLSWNFSPSNLNRLSLMCRHIFGIHVLGGLKHSPYPRIKTMVN